MQYWAKIKKQEDRKYLVEFSQLEGCFTEGESLEDALKQAKEALDGWLAARCDRDLKIPEPKRRKERGYYPVEVDIQVAFAVRLRRLRMKRGLSQAELAKRLGISQQAYAKLETPLKANPSLLTIRRLSSALDTEITDLLAA